MHKMKTKQSRRDFLRVSAAGALGALAIFTNTGFKACSQLKSAGIGLQLYTIRDAMDADVTGFT